MQLNSFSNIIIAVIILASAGVVYLVLSLKMIKEEILSAAYKLNFDVQKRMDLIPLFIENVTGSFGADRKAEIIAKRADSMAVKVGEKGKIDLEEGIWQTIDQMMLEMKNDDNNKLQIAAFKADLQSINEQITNLKISYNDKVNKYNGWVNNPVFKYIIRMFKYTQMEVF